MIDRDVKIYLGGQQAGRKEVSQWINDNVIARISYDKSNNLVLRGVDLRKIKQEWKEKAIIWGVKDE
jgi:hypothetical protein